MLKIWQLGIVIFLLVGLSVLFASYNLSIIVSQKSTLGDDHTPPAPAQFSELPPTKTSNKSSILIGLAEIDSTLKILDNDKTVKTVKINESARFNTDIPLEIGENNISLVVVDKSGNEGEQASRLRIIRN